MSNMSYCRFSNTLADLIDCKDALSETYDTPDWAKLSEGERRAAERLIKLCTRIAGDYADE